MENLILQTILLRRENVAKPEKNEGERLLSQNYEVLKKLDRYQYSRWRRFKFWIRRRKMAFKNWRNKRKNSCG
jgi:hypothetical protein